MPDLSKINKISDEERRANRIAAGLPLGDCLIIQVSQDDVRMPRPFPYVINHETGDVSDQEFWKGDPARLLGFQADADVQRVNLFFEDWAAGDIQKAVGMYPVFVKANGGMYCLALPVGSAGWR